MINFAGFFPATIVMLPLGSMTDLVSKRKILQLPAIATLLSCLINLCSSYFIKLLEGFLVLGSFIISIFGYVPGSNALCCAYSIRARSNDIFLAVVTVNTSVRTGLATGNHVASYLARYYGYSSAVLSAIIALFINLLYALLFVLPVDDDGRERPTTREYKLWYDFKEHTKDSWLHLVRFVKKHICQSSNNVMLLLLVAAFLSFPSHGGEMGLLLNIVRYVCC